MNSTSIRTKLNAKPLERGFTLVEIAIVVIIMGALFVFLMPLSSCILENQKREITRQKLKNIESAMANYVAINKRLPCPADGTIAPGNANAGVEGARTGGDCTNNQISGVVPWVTLGLTQADIQDGWYHLITYRAAFSLTRDNVLDMSFCDTAGTKGVDTSSSTAPGGKCWASCLGSDMTTCTSPQNYLVGKGFDIRNGSGVNLIMSGSGSSFTGAAYILISHGGNGYGAYDASGSYIAVGTGITGDIEAFNINGPAVSVTNTLPLTANTFRDTEFAEGTAALYFDDHIVRPSVFALIQRAQLGPRSH